MSEHAGNMHLVKLTCSASKKWYYSTLSSTIAYYQVRSEVQTPGCSAHVRFNMRARESGGLMAGWVAGLSRRPVGSHAMEAITRPVMIDVEKWHLVTWRLVWGILGHCGVPRPGHPLYSDY